MAKSTKIKKTTTQVSRFNPKPNEGLKQEQIKKRTEAGLVNVSNIKTSKSIGGIFAKNIFTFF